MLNALDVKTLKNSVKVQILGDSTQKKKAYNHNIGDTLPKRQFIPDDTSKSKKNGQFRKEILQAIDGLIKDVK